MLERRFEAPGYSSGVVDRNATFIECEAVTVHPGDEQHRMRRDLRFRHTKEKNAREAAKYAKEDGFLLVPTSEFSTWRVTELRKSSARPLRLRFLGVLGVLGG